MLFFLFIKIISSKNFASLKKSTQQMRVSVKFVSGLDLLFSLHNKATAGCVCGHKQLLKTFESSLTHNRRGNYCDIEAFFVCVCVCVSRLPTI